MVLVLLLLYIQKSLMVVGWVGVLLLVESFPFFGCCSHNNIVHCNEVGLL